MKFDYSYYKDIYGGELTESEFCRCGEVASDVIAALLFGDRVGVDAECDNDATLRALCCEVDYISSEGLGAERGSVVREALGDWSVTYGDGGHSMSCGGIPLSPAAVAALRAGGLLTRWV